MGWNISKEDFIKNKSKYYRKIRKDIEVYKIGIIANNNYFVPCFRKDFTYYNNKVSEFVDLKIENNDQYIYTNKGYHSYLMSSLYRITNSLLTYSYKHEDVNMPFIGKFIIPKGCEYYIDDIWHS